MEFIYHTKDKILETKKGIYKTTNLEHKFLMEFKFRNFIIYEFLCYGIYDNYNEKTMQNLRMLKDRMIKKTKLKFKTIKNKGIMKKTKIIYM